MSKRARRILITVLILLVAAAVLAAVFTAPPRQSPSPPPIAANSPLNQPTAAPADSTPDHAAPGEPLPTEAVSGELPPVQPLTGLRAQAPAADDRPADLPPQPLGSLDPRVHLMKLEFSRKGASIARVAFTDIWETATAKRRADRYYRKLQPDEVLDLSQVDESQRFYLTNVARAQSVSVNGQIVDLQMESAWAETAPGKFETQIVSEDGEPILHITRQFILGNVYDITLQQRLRNLSNLPLNVQWRQFGPTELAADTGYIDRRRMASGYLPDPVRQPDLVLTGDFEFERGDVIKRHSKSVEAAQPSERDAHLTLWPNATSRSRGYHLSWFASMNRYFSVSVHPTAEDVARGSRSLEGVIESIRFDVFSTATAGQDKVIFTTLHSPMLALAPAAEKTLNVGVYVGPLDRDVLAQPPYSLLAMGEMILYSMGGCCTFISWQWLATLLLNFLSILHDYVVFDWGIAIMLLVVVVRVLLHPLTKKSQINMQRFGKQMSAMKPELDKLQKKYGGDKQRMQVEQMKLMREHGVNPLQMVGCLPMFLQMPIWIALWAMLYLAFDIRHQPAFYGLFQLFGNWQFLGDLSSPDHFWMLPGGGFTIPLVDVKINALNLLPLLLGVVFYIQQKYMSPPPSPNVTPEQLQQQKIMKVMMVVMMPVFLYKAPSGLTLYIFTSTFIGIMESKYIRAHIDQLDLGKAGGGESVVGAPRDKPRKPKDSLGRMWAEKLEAARAKAAAKRAEPPKSFKKRK